MKITIIGTGYVGLVSGTCFAETGNNVMCIDIDEKKIATLKSGKLPIYEPGLLELVQRNASEGRLTFSTDIAEGIKHGDVVLLRGGNTHRKKTIGQTYSMWKRSQKVLEKTSMDTRSS
jgi:UDPglucose 6-dehydrogenase